MGKHFFDFKDGNFGGSISDNMAIHSDGNMMMRISDNIAIDLDSSDIHIISSWSNDNKDED